MYGYWLYGSVKQQYSNSDLTLQEEEEEQQQEVENCLSYVGTL